MNLTVVIPSKNANNLRACVAAVRQHEPLLNIIVIDDGLDRAALDGPECWGCANDPLQIVAGVKPFVYARNVNIGIRLAGQDDVVLLNDDAQLETRSGFSRLQRQWLVHPECGLISAATNGASLDQIRRGGESLRYAPLMVAFVCVFIPRQTIETIGLLDEQFGIGADGTGPRGYGCEDDDYCRRVREAGLKLGVHDGSFVDHRKLPSTFRHDPARPADVIAHEKLFAAKWGQSPRVQN